METFNFKVLVPAGQPGTLCKANPYRLAPRSEAEARGISRGRAEGDNDVLTFSENLGTGTFAT